MLWDNLDKWGGAGGGSEVRMVEAYVYLWLIHVIVWDKPMQHWKAIIL